MAMMKLKEIMRNGAKIMLLYRYSSCVYVLHLCCVYVHFK